MANMEKALLELLQEDCRVSLEKMAVMLGITADEVKESISRLEAEGIVVKYSALVNWDKTGDECVTALIDVKVMPERGLGFDQIAERIYRFPEVKSVTLISGGYDLSVVVEGSSMKEVALFVAEKLAPIENVQSTATHFMLRRYKMDGVILAEREGDKRLVVSP